MYNAIFDSKYKEFIDFWKNISDTYNYNSDSKFRGLSAIHILVYAN